MLERITDFSPSRSLWQVGVFGLVGNLLALAPALFTLQVYDRVLTSRSGDTLLWLFVLLVVALLALSALEAVRARLLALVGARFEAAAGDPLLARMLSTSVTGGDRSAAAAFADLHRLRRFVGSPTLASLFDLPWCPVYLAVIVLFSPLMGGVAIAGILLLFGLTWLDDRATRAVIEHAGGESRDAAALVDGALAGADTVQAMGMAGAIAARWRMRADVARSASLAAQRRGTGFVAVSRFVRQVLQAGMILLGAWLVIGQQATPGVLIAATLVLGRAIAPIESAIAGWRGLVEARGAWRRLRAVFDAMPAPAGALALPPPAGRLVVERLVYGPDAARPLLRGVDFHLAAGEQLGLIGPSGAGKSTLARLVLGLARPRAGGVRLDGVDVAAVHRDRLGPHVGYLPQEVVLFDGSVAANIARMQDPAEHGDAVLAAARLAGVHELVLALPDGYDTRVGPGGVVLSVGQRQRVGLARALFGDPALVVLDEPNANLDGEGELALQRALAALRRRGATVVVITHRPALLAAVDKVLLLKSGAVAEFGARDEVMRRVMGAGPAVPTLVRGVAG